MEVEPKLKWIHVKVPFDKKEKEELILLPESFKPAQDEYKTPSVVTDPAGEYERGDILIVPSHVIREVKISENVFCFVERNHVMARLK